MTETAPWEEMDDWCKRRSADISDRAWKMLANGVPLGNPHYRRLLGQSDAFHQMRSYIHGAKAKS